MARADREPGRHVVERRGLSRTTMVAVLLAILAIIAALILRS